MSSTQFIQINTSITTNCNNSWIYNLSHMLWPLFVAIFWEYQYLQ